MDILMTDDDITLTADNDLAVVTGVNAIAQHIKMRLRTWLGELDAFDTTEGVPYLQVIFVGPFNSQEVQFIFQQNILQTPGVLNASLEAPVFDAATGLLQVVGRVTTIDGDVDFSEQIEIQA